MLVAVGLSRFPKIELKEDEKGGSKDSYLALFRQKYVWLFFLGIFWLCKYGTGNFHLYEHVPSSSITE